ncbi:MAG: prepilin-type N-terminal cleavage/methylation domain-containing protein [Fibrobacter sp.]|nr:prepilin-type N-terminal cleavage/methylation domain-containing protein [Fibrobacter sp.]
MLTRILNNIRKFCSLKVPQGTSQNKWKGGFTLIELMVVIIIVNLLSGVAIPKCTDLIEKAKERTDLLKFYYLRDALDRALYEDNVTRIDETEGSKCGSTVNNANTLSKWLEEEQGVSLFIIELHDKFQANYQAENNNRTKDTHNMCGLLSTDGFWSQAFRDAGFGAVADIVYARAKGAKTEQAFANYPGDYSVTTETGAGYKGNETWARTYPKTPLFNSRALNNDPQAKFVNNSTQNGQIRYSMKARWTNCDKNSHSLDIFLAKDGSTNFLTSRLGTIFSTTTQKSCPAKTTTKK